jgi:hypothetical protein
LRATNRSDFVPLRKIDFVGRVENLQQDMRFTIEKFLVQSLLQKHFILIEQFQCQKKKLLTDDLKKIYEIYKIYEIDFKLQGYPKQFGLISVLYFLIYYKKIKNKFAVLDDLYFSKC